MEFLSYLYQAWPVLLLLLAGGVVGYGFASSVQSSRIVVAKCKLLEANLETKRAQRATEQANMDYRAARDRIRSLENRLADRRVTVLNEVSVKADDSGAGVRIEEEIQRRVEARRQRSAPLSPAPAADSAPLTNLVVGMALGSMIASESKPAEPQRADPPAPSCDPPSSSDSGGGFSSSD